MPGITFSEKRTEGDLVRYNMRQDYTCVAALVYNRTGSTISANDVMGHPLEADSVVSGAYRFCIATRESYCSGLLLDTRSFQQQTLANAGNFWSRALVRGPAIIDKTFIPTTDVAGASFTLATLVTALEAKVPPILCHGEPTITVTQTN